MISVNNLTKEFKTVTAVENISFDNRPADRRILPYKYHISSAWMSGLPDTMSCPSKDSGQGI